MKPTQFKFNKESDNKWYIDYPEWTGDKWELEMVLGADTMLDIIAQGENVAYLTISTEPFKIDADHAEVKIDAFTLTKVKDTPNEGGAVYIMKEWYGFEYNLEMWLCHVTEFVFGYLPDVIYIA